VLSKKRTQGRQIAGCHLLKQLRIAKHLLDHKRIDINQAGLKQMQAEQPGLLIFPPIGGKFSALAVTR
jgi:hypothetical protein